LTDEGVLTYNTCR